ncbi:MAG: hypothetical protein ACXW5U_26925 [Thermoanaerobaculia bacterium]
MKRDREGGRSKAVAIRMPPGAAALRGRTSLAHPRSPASERGARLEPRAFARQGTVKVHLRAIFEKLSVYARENALL